MKNKTSESSKLVLVEKLLALSDIKIKRNDGMAQAKIDQILILMEEILSVGTAEDGIDSRKYFSVLTRKAALLELLDLTDKTVDDYIESKKDFYKPFTKIQKEELRGIFSKAIFVETIEKIVEKSNVQQIERLLKLLFKNQMYVEIIQVCSLKASSEVKAFMKEFCLSNITQPGLLAVSSRASADTFSDAEYGRILLDLEAHCKKSTQQSEAGAAEAVEPTQQSEEESVEAVRSRVICRQFLEGAAQQPTMSEFRRHSLVTLLRNLCTDTQNLVSVFFEFGFRPLAVYLFPVLRREEYLALLADRRLHLTLKEVDDLVAPGDKSELEYYNELFRAFYYSDSPDRANTRRTETTITTLVKCYGDSWQQREKKEFADALRDPAKAIYRLDEISSVSVLLALFEQFSLQKSTKDMCFNYRLTKTKEKSSEGKISMVNSADQSPDPYRKEIAFVRCCKSLAGRMNANHAGRLLRFLINDKDLHTRIPDLIWQPTLSDAVLEVYCDIYLEIMHDPNADPGLRAILSPFGGVLMEKMNRWHLSKLLDSLRDENRHDELRALLMKCRSGGQGLLEEHIEVLVDFFVGEGGPHPTLKKVLFPEVFAYLSSRLMPAMNEQQRQRILLLPENVVTLPLVQSLFPVNDYLPVARYLDCVRIIILRSVKCEPALRHVVDYFKRLNDKTIDEMFTIYCKEGVRGEALTKVLVKDYFLEFLKHLVSRTDESFEDTYTKTVLSFFERILDATDNDEQLKGLIVALAEGLKDSKLEKKYRFFITKLFENPKLHQRLFKMKGSVELFTSVVDFFITMDLELLKPIIDFISNSDEFTGPFIQLVTVFSGRRVIERATNDGNLNDDNGCFQKDIIDELLDKAKSISSYEEKILEQGESFILRCCQSDNVLNLAVLKLFLDFGCRPCSADCEDNTANFVSNNPFHLAAAFKSIPMLTLMLPHLKRVGVGIMRTVFAYQVLNPDFSKEAFDLVFKVAQEKNSDLSKNSKLCSLYGILRIPAASADARPMLEAYLSMINAGIEPQAEALEYIALFVVQQDADFILQFTQALRANALNSYLLCLKALYEDRKTDLISAFLPRELFPSNPNGSADYDALYQQKGLVPFTNYGEAFITAVEAALGVKRKIETLQIKAAEPATERSESSTVATTTSSLLSSDQTSVRSAAPFFGGGNVVPETQASPKRAGLSTIPPAKAAAQPTVTTAPLFFGGSNEVPRTVAPMKRAKLGAASPVKAAAQPPVTPAPLFFGGGNVVPKKVAPAKRAVLATSLAVTASLAVQQDKSKTSAKDDQSASALDSASLATQKGL